MDNVLNSAGFGATAGSNMKSRRFEVLSEIYCENNKNNHLSGTFVSFNRQKQVTFDALKAT